jgi:hypothetical protein
MDGYQWSDVERYSKSCTLTVIVQDRNGEPVDGALVKLFSEMWPQSPSILYQCFNGATNQYGVFTTTLGDHQNYYVSIESPMGYTSAEMVLDSTEAIPGSHIYWMRNLDGEMPRLSVSPDSLPDNPKQDYMVEIIYRLVDQTVYGVDCYNDYGNNRWAYKLYPGVVDFFLTDEANFSSFLGGMGFDSYKIFRKLDRGFTWLVLPTDGDYFCIFSNSEYINLSQSLYVTVNLYRNTNIGIAADRPNLKSGNLRVVAKPNPFRECSSVLVQGIRRTTPDTRLEVCDASGRLVREIPLPSGKDSQNSVILEWDGRDSKGQSLPGGIYFLGLTGMSPEARTKVVRVR